MQTTCQRALWIITELFSSERFILIRRRYVFLMYAILIVCSVALMTGCDSPEIDRYSREFKSGYQEGYDKGLTEGNEFKQGYDKGYVEGFESARPGSGGHPTGIWRILAIAASVLGLSKIILSLLIFTVYVVFRSETWHETTAKAIVTSLALLVLFWLSNSLTIGFTSTLDDLFLKAGAGNPIMKIVWGVLGIIGMYALLSVLWNVAKKIEGHPYFQAFCVFISTMCTTILIEFFVSLKRVPDLHRYLIYDLILGVVIGGILYIVKTVFNMGDQYVRTLDDEVRNKSQR